MSTVNWQEILGSSFEAALLERMREWRVPGVAITLVPDNERDPPVFKTYNDKGQTVGPLVKEETRFAVASCSKLVAALALVTALKQNGHDKGLDTRIIDIEPRFELSDPIGTQKCTVRDIIGHRTFIPAFDFFVFRPLEEGVDILDVVKGLPLTRAWGEPGPSIYSSAVQQVVFPLIERLTGMQFEQYIAKTIFDPLGMTQSGYSVEDVGEDMAFGYQARYTPDGIEDRLMIFRSPLDKLGKTCGMASVRLITSIQDVAKLLKYMKDFPDFAEMSQPFCDLENCIPTGDIMSGEMMGAGTLSIKMGKYLMSGHTGAFPGFRTHILRVPELEFGIGILTNSTEGLDIALWVEAWVIGKITSDTMLLEKVCAQIERGRKETLEMETAKWKGIAAEGTEQLLGTFYSPSFGTWTFTDSSSFAARPDGITMSTIPWLPHLFGKTRPIVVSMGDGKFDGFLEWTPGPGQDDSFGVQYGYWFKVEEESDYIKVFGIDTWTDNAEMKPPAVLWRV